MRSDPGFIGNVLPVVAVDLFERHDVFSAAVVLEVCLRHPDPLVRAAAGGTYLELSFDEEREGALRTLVAGTFDPDPEVRDMAATLLADSVPDHPRLEELGGGELPGGGGAPLQTALLIHGTWAASSSWWQPGGGFNNYILRNVRPDLYVLNDRFGWSGRYSNQERALAALRLSAWTAAHGSMRIDCVIAHSHGASVAMMATWAALQIDELVLLSCPFHLPKRFDKKVLSSLETSDCRYLPNFANVKRIESIRVRLDRVILADRGGQRFDLAPIHENPPVGWFDHSATHNPATWLRYGIDKWVS
jgi:pimeloyl-ACP methyl ester carboxylesterase